MSATVASARTLRSLTCRAEIAIGLEARDRRPPVGCGAVEFSQSVTNVPRGTMRTCLPRDWSKQPGSRTRSGRCHGSGARAVPLPRCPHYPSHWRRLRPISGLGHGHPRQTAARITATSTAQWAGHGPNIAVNQTCSQPDKLVWTRPRHPTPHRRPVTSAIPNSMKWPPQPPGLSDTPSCLSSWPDCARQHVQLIRLIFA